MSTLPPFNRDYLYADVSHIEDLVGDLVDDRKFTDRTAISIDMVDAALVSGSIYIIGQLNPIRPAPKSVLIEQASDESGLVLYQLVESHKYISSVILYDMFPTRGSPVQRDPKKSQTGRKRQETLFARYKQFVSNLKHTLHYANIKTPPNRTNFFVGQDYDFTGRGLNQVIPKYNPYLSGGEFGYALRGFGPLD